MCGFQVPWEAAVSSGLMPVELAADK